MALNVILLSQTAGYIIVFILALCVNIPLAVNFVEFNNHCLLFSTGKWNQSNGQFEVNWSSDVSCAYPISLNCVVLMLSIYQIYKCSTYLYQDLDSTFLASFFDVVLSIFFAILTVVAACMVTLGFITWCDAMIQCFPSCKESGGHQIDIVDDINTSNFYIELGTAQFAIWALFAAWVALSVCALLKMWKYHQLDIIRNSMYNERRKLAQREQSSDLNLNQEAEAVSQAE